MSIDCTPIRQLYPFESRWFDSSWDASTTSTRARVRRSCCVTGNPTWSFLYRDIIVAPGPFPLCGSDLSGFHTERPSTVPDRRARARVIGEFVDHLGLDRYLSMGQDWVARSAWRSLSSVPTVCGAALDVVLVITRWR